MNQAPAHPMRAFLVDDEAPARRTLRELLQPHSDVEVVGECATGPEAVEAIKAARPDLLFLDIQLPGFSGFEVLQRLRKDVPTAVVFVTAYDEHAIRAFEVQALDYLLKPFDDERFLQALERAKLRVRQQRLEALAGEMVSTLGEKGNQATAQVQSDASPEYLKRIVLRDAGRISFLEVAEIDWIEAQDYYVQLHAGGKSHLLRETMRNLERQLDPRRFVRIHRSAIVNIERVQELQPFFHGEYTVLLRDGTRLRLSRNYRNQLRVFLGSN